MWATIISHNFFLWTEGAIMISPQRIAAISCSGWESTNCWEAICLTKKKCHDSSVDFEDCVGSLYKFLEEWLVFSLINYSRSWQRYFYNFLCPQKEGFLMLAVWDLEVLHKNNTSHILSPSFWSCVLNFEVESFGSLNFQIKVYNQMTSQRFRPVHKNMLKISF